MMATVNGERGRRQQVSEGKLNSTFLTQRLLFLCLMMMMMMMMMMKYIVLFLQRTGYLTTDQYVLSQLHRPSSINGRQVYEQYSLLVAIV